jgi:hypothetical protein
MSFTLALLILTQALGLFALLINILRAPDGYEDEAGFHAGTKSTGNEVFYDAFSDRQIHHAQVYVKKERQIAV